MKSADDKSVGNNIDSKIEHLRRFCAYQDRSKSQLKIQAAKIGIPHSKFDEVVTTLSDEGFFNEQRFAIAFVRGKFRINKWGKIKIKSELFAKQIPSDLIDLALNEIDDQEYKICLFDLIKKNSRKSYLMKYKQEYIKECNGLGFSNMDIAFSLGVTERAVRKHLHG